MSIPLYFPKGILMIVFPRGSIAPDRPGMARFDPGVLPILARQTPG